MSLYKYMPPESMLRFLSSWALRITPPDQFNDPFEMRPPIEVITESDIFSPDVLRREFAERMAVDLVSQGAVALAKSPWVTMFVSKLLGELTTKQERVFWDLTPISLRQTLKAQFPNIQRELEAALEYSRGQLPKLVKRVETNIHDSIPKMIGALCMTKNGRHPLMWAHYANEHRGAVIEFDEMAPCFNRKSANEELGVFKKVNYSSTRPNLNQNSGDEWFRDLTLTKAEEWAYEEEMRFLLLLSAADDVLEDSIHLVRIPSTAVKSITLGCRASEALLDHVRRQLNEAIKTSHIVLRKAVVDSKVFILNYEEMSK